MGFMDYVSKKYPLKNYVTGEYELVEYSQAYLNYYKQVREKLEEAYADGHEPTLAELKELNLMFKVMRAMEQSERDMALADRILPKLKQMYCKDIDEDGYELDQEK